MGETRKDALRVSSDRVIKWEFHGARVSLDAGLFPFRDLNEAVQLTGSSAAELFDFRPGSNSVSARVFKMSKASAERQVRTARQCLRCVLQDS